MKHISFDPKKAMYFEKYAHKMIKISQEKMDHNKLDARVKLQHGYIDNLPQSEEYDAATLIFILRSKHRSFSIFLKSMDEFYET